MGPQVGCVEESSAPVGDVRSYLRTIRPSAATPPTLPGGLGDVMSNPDAIGVGSVRDSQVGCSSSDVLVGDGRPRLHPLADEPPEDESAVAGVATIEPKDELVEVTVEVLVGHTSLVGAEEPPLEERRDTMDVGVDKVSFARRLRQRGGLGRVVKPASGKFFQGRPYDAQSSQCNTEPGFDAAFEKIGDGQGGRIGQAGETNLSARGLRGDLTSDRDRRLLATRAPRSPGIHAPDVGLIELDIAAQSVSTGLVHGRPQFLQQ